MITSIILNVVLKIQYRKKEFKKMKGKFDQTIIWEHKVWQLSLKCYFYNLPFEYEQRFLAKQQIYCLIHNILKQLKFSSIERFFDNQMFENNPQNAKFDCLPFDDDQRFIAGK